MKMTTLNQDLRCLIDQYLDEQIDNEGYQAQRREILMKIDQDYNHYAVQSSSAERTIERDKNTIAIETGNYSSQPVTIQPHNVIPDTDVRQSLLSRLFTALKR